MAPLEIAIFIYDVTPSITLEDVCTGVELLSATVSVKSTPKAAWCDVTHLAPIRAETIARPRLLRDATAM